MGKRWSFVLEITSLKDSDIRKRVEKAAEDAVNTIGKPQQNAVFKLRVTFCQSKGRWRKDNPLIPREDIGRDLDNLLKAIFNGLGPIIGYRTQWEKGGKPKGKGSARDSSIVEVFARKVNSGTEKEYLYVEVEEIPVNREEDRKAREER